MSDASETDYLSRHAASREPIRAMGRDCCQLGSTGLAGPEQDDRDARGQQRNLQVVDDFSWKLDLPQTQETVESIDANHMQMAKCSDRNDLRYRAIVGVLKQFMRLDMPGESRIRPQETPPTGSSVEIQTASAAGFRSFLRSQQFYLVRWRLRLEAMPRHST